MAKFSVKLLMSQDKKEELQSLNYILAAFKTVGTTDVDPLNAAPVVWFLDPRFDTSTTVTWVQEYTVFKADDDFKHGAELKHENDHPANLGESWMIDDRGNFKLEPHKPPNQIRIHNATKDEYLIGLGQASNTGSGAKFDPICAMRAIENSYRLFQPIEQVVLIFVSKTVKMGTIYTSAATDGVLISGGSDKEPPTVTYTNTGEWEGGGGSTVAPENFVSSCIQKIS